MSDPSTVAPANDIPPTRSRAGDGRPRRRTGWLLLLLLGAGLAVAADPPAPAPGDAARPALERLNSLVGEWRGVGQPRRQSNRGAWTETVNWVWDLHDDQAALVQTVTGGKLTRRSRLTYDNVRRQYQLSVESPEGATTTLTGGWEEGRLVLTSPGDAAGVRQRLTITPLTPIRHVVLHEATEPGKDLFFRVAEVGCTRQGERLAGEGGGQPQCVVTGGLGTIEVRHQGRTYYVCCTGCQQAFEDNPEKILREYRERLTKAAAPVPPR